MVLLTKLLLLTLSTGRKHPKAGITSGPRPLHPRW